MNREDLKLLPLASVGLAKGVMECYVAPVFEDWETKEWALVALASAVIAYDLLCPKGQTISEGVDRLLEKYPVATRLAGAVIVGHLANIIPNPDKYDPIHRMVAR